MNDWLVVDASVIVKAFVDEQDSNAADAVWASEASLFAPAHALAEVGEVFRRKRARNEITQVQLEQACLVLPRSFLAVALDELFASAMDITQEIPPGFYDALYIAAGDRWNCPVIRRKVACKRGRDCLGPRGWSL